MGEIPQELLDELLADYERPEDLVGPDGLMKQLFGRLVETAAGSELTDHLGYEKGDTVGRGSGNSRNGTTPKTLLTDHGEVPVEMPRDRNGSFEPQIVEKGQTHFDGFDDKIISMYAGGMTYSEIQGHLADIYGVEVSKDFLTRVTDAVMDDVRAWQNRPLDPWRFLPVVANHDVLLTATKLVRTCSGVRSSSTRRGRWLSSRATLSRSWRVCMAKLVCFGKYWRTSPLVFSLVARCQGERGSQKKISIPERALISSWRVSSLPWSQVSVLRIGDGISSSRSMSASRTCGALCPSGRWTRITNRLRRSTKVPIAE